MMIANPMTARESFDSFYTRKLDALKIQLKEKIKGDIPYTVSAVYACVHCQGRIFLHTLEGQIRCLRCEMPSLWPAELQKSVSAIMQSYPSLEASHVEWEALQGKEVAPKEKRVRTPKHGDVELGKRIREARLKLGLSKRELGAKIFKFKVGGKECISGKSIEGYENGYVRPPEKILEQIKQAFKKEGIVLEMKGQENG